VTVAEKKGGNTVLKVRKRKIGKGEGEEGLGRDAMHSSSEKKAHLDGVGRRGRRSRMAFVARKGGEK